MSALVFKRANFKLFNELVIRVSQESRVFSENWSFFKNQSPGIVNPIVHTIRLQELLDLTVEIHSIIYKVPETVKRSLITRSFAVLYLSTKQHEIRSKKLQIYLFNLTDWKSYKEDCPRGLPKGILKTKLLSVIINIG